MTDTAEAPPEEQTDPNPGTSIVSVDRPPYAGLDPAIVAHQGEILRKASAASPVRQIRYLLNAMANGYAQIADDVTWCEEEDIDYAIEFAGALSTGMLIVTPAGVHELNRVLVNGTRYTLHVKISADPEGWDLAQRFNSGKLDYYIELPAGAGSPVVVRA